MKQIPQMGTHLMLDFHNIENVNLLLDADTLATILENGLLDTDCHICSKIKNTYAEKKGFSILYLLSGIT